MVADPAAYRQGNLVKKPDLMKTLKAVISCLFVPYIRRIST